MITRRSAIGCITYPLAAAAVGPMLSMPRRVHAQGSGRETPDSTHALEPMVLDETPWREVALAFTVDRSLVNLNNGGVSPSPRYVQEAMKRHLDYSHEAPPYTMWRVLEPQREGVRQRLARTFGADPEEIAITRNASEGLQILQFGFVLSPRDEVLCTTQDYPRMINTFKQRERREGIRLRQFRIPVPCEEPGRIVRLYEENITPRTRLILVSHVVFLTGQVMPVRAIAELGRRRGIPVIVDGAHALAHVPFTLPELSCDYYATSLHKWLHAPHGTGLLFVRKERIKDLWPLMASGEGQDEDIRKFEEIGTHPAANAIAIGEAITFNQTIGFDRKAARLRSLRDRWSGRLLSASDRVRMLTPSSPGLSYAIATVAIDGLDPVELNSWLWNRHRILTVAIDHEDVKGLRVSPSVYTTEQELDRFCDAVEHAIRNGID